MARATINIDELTNLITGLETAIDDLSFARSDLQSAAATYDLDSEMPGEVDPAITWAEGELPGLRRRLSMAIAVEAQTVGESPGIAVLEDDTAIPTTDPDEAQANGRETALALVEADGVPDLALIEEVAENANDPYFAAGLAQELSPEEIASILGEFDEYLEENEPEGIGLTTPMGEWGERYGEVVEFNELVDGYELLVTGLGTTMGTASNNVGDLALPDSYAEQWAAVITDDEWENNDGAALALLLENGTYSTSFLDTVSEAVYNEEIDSDPSDPVWGPRGEIRGLNGDDVFDPMASVMSALGRNPEAAQNFFNGGGTIDEAVHEDDITYTYDPPVSSRLQYLLQERTWADSSDNSNGGYLGEALEAATTHFRNDEYSGLISAKIASQTFLLIGQHTGYNPDGNDRVWQMWDGMREPMANIVASYSSDLIHVANQEGDHNELAEGWFSIDSARFGDDVPYGANMDRDAMGNLLGTLGENDEQIDIVLSGLAVASRWRIDMGLDDATSFENSDGRVDFLQGNNVPAANATNEVSLASGWVIGEMFEGARDDEDRQMSEFEAQQRFVNALTSMPNAIPGGAWGSYAFNQLKDLAFEEMEGNLPTGADGDYSELAEQTSTALERMVLNELLQRGFFDDEVFEEANGGPDGGPYGDPMPDGVVIEGSDPPEFDFASDAWDEWINKPFVEFIGDHVTGPFFEGLEEGRTLVGK